MCISSLTSDKQKIRKRVQITKKIIKETQYGCAHCVNGYEQ